VASPRTIMDYIRLASAHLDASGVQSPRLDAEVLLADLLGIERIQLYVQYDRPLIRPEVDAYRRRIARRARREPVAYITGKREFYSLEFKVDRRCLVPRPETEHLVDTALAELAARFAGKDYLKVADVGTGSGAIAVSVARTEPRAVVTATDIDAGALALAAENAERHGVSDRVRFVEGDLLVPLGDEMYDCILSNPPYVADEDWEKLPPDVRLYEPKIALAGGPDGLACIRRLITSAWPRLAPGGFLALEIGYDQGQRVLELARAEGYAHARLVKDLAGHDRVAVMAKE